MPEAEVGLASKSAAWCWKSKSQGIALRSISETRQKSLEMDTVNLFRPITKFSEEIVSTSSVSEVVANAFRAAESGRPGAAFYRDNHWLMEIVQPEAFD